MAGGRSCPPASGRLRSDRLKPDNTTTSYPAGMRVGPLCCGGQQSGAVVDDNGAAKFHAASYPRRAHPQRCFVSGDRNPSRHLRQGMARPGAQTEPVKQPPARQTTCLARRPLPATRTPACCGCRFVFCRSWRARNPPPTKAEPGVPRGRNRGARGVGWWSGVDAAVPLWPVLATWAVSDFGS